MIVEAYHPMEQVEHYKLLAPLQACVAVKKGRYWKITVPTPFMLNMFQEARSGKCLQAR